jgi:hypothetical protein
MSNTEKKIANMTLTELDALEAKIAARDDIAQWKKIEVFTLIDVARAAWLESFAGDEDC